MTAPCRVFSSVTINCCLRIHAAITDEKVVLAKIQGGRMESIRIESTELRRQTRRRRLISTSPPLTGAMWTAWNSSCENWLTEWLPCRSKSPTSLSQKSATIASKRLNHSNQPASALLLVCSGIYQCTFVIHYTANTRSIGTVHTSAKARLTSVAIRIRIRMDLQYNGCTKI